MRGSHTHYRCSRFPRRSLSAPSQDCPTASLAANLSDRHQIAGPRPPATNFPFVYDTTIVIQGTSQVLCVKVSLECFEMSRRPTTIWRTACRVRARDLELSVSKIHRFRVIPSRRAVLNVDPMRPVQSVPFFCCCATPARRLRKNRHSNSCPARALCSGSAISCACRTLRPHVPFCRHFVLLGNNDSELV